MKEITELQELIIEWAKEKNLNNPDKQYLKILEEVGETARAILKNDVREIKDGIGDIAVTVIIYYWQRKANLSDISYPEKYPIISNEFRDIIRCVDTLDKTTLDCLNDLASHFDTTLKECLNLAWNEIKDRKGKTVNGTFIKN